MIARYAYRKIERSRLCPFSVEVRTASGCRRNGGTSLHWHNGRGLWRVVLWVGGCC